MWNSTHEQRNAHARYRFGLVVHSIGVRITEESVGEKASAARTAQVHRIIASVRRGTPIVVAVADFAKGAVIHVQSVPGAVPPADIGGFRAAVAGGDVFPGIIPGVAFGLHT